MSEEKQEPIVETLEVTPEPDLRAMVAALAQQNAEMKAYVEAQASTVSETRAAQIKAAREAFVGGINGGLTDDSVYSLLPEVDTGTEEGKKTVRDWAAKHPALFRGVGAPGGQIQRPAPVTFGGQVIRTFSEIMGGGKS